MPADLGHRQAGGLGIMKWDGATAVRPKPHAEGYDAYYNGDTVDMCRYTGADADDWKTGWRRARAEDQRAELAEEVEAERRVRAAGHQSGGFDGQARRSG